MPARDVVVTSATPLYSALLLVSLTRISEIELNEGNSSAIGPLFSTFTLLMPSMVNDINAGVVPAITRLLVIVHLHAGLRRQRQHRAGRSIRSRVDRDRQIHQFMAGLGRSQARLIGRDHVAGRLHLDRLRRRADRQAGIDTLRIARLQHQVIEDLILEAVGRILTW